MRRADHWCHDLAFAKGQNWRPADEPNVHFLKSDTKHILISVSSIDQIIIFTCETNALTLTVAIVDAVVFTALASAWHITINVMLVKLYINSALVSLNARSELQRENVGPRSIGDSSTRGPSRATAPYPVRVHVQTTCVCQPFLWATSDCILLIAIRSTVITSRKTYARDLWLLRTLKADCLYRWRSTLNHSR